ncbi:hypothetical protein V7150_07825 [Neobacillus drentensis]|uniref:hypothetical protein n=1 Tax=Neobacillus drentensis TaxID=220684 RepID=UPI002FFF2E14
MNFQVQSGEFQTLDQLVKSIDNIPRKQSTLLIGIDGCGGSGKSTLANFFKVPALVRRIFTNKSN